MSLLGTNDSSHDLPHGVEKKICIFILLWLDLAFVIAHIRHRVIFDTFRHLLAAVVMMAELVAMFELSERIYSP